MIKMGVSPLAPLYPPEAATQQTDLYVAAYAAMDLTLNNLTETGVETYVNRAFQDENQADGEYSRTHLHETQVGGILLAVTEQPQIALAGCTHDTGKGRDEVREIINLPRRLVDQEWEVVNAHPELGAQDLEAAFKDPELGALAQFVARHHHAARPDTFATAEQRYNWDITSLVQVADRAQAMLLDWKGRPYKADRMTSEGLLDDVGKPVMDRILEEVLGAEADQTYLGINVGSIIRFTVDYMPPAEEIQALVALNRSVR
jgi:hypothetical protein